MLFRSHLGNVLAVISDKKIPQFNTDALPSSGLKVFSPEVLSYSDYYPFGMLVPNRHGSSDSYRFGFNGKEKDDELKGEGNSYDFGARMLDPRIGRWFAPDKEEDEFPWQSTYSFVSDSPLWRIDPDGNWDIEVHASSNRSKYGYATMIVKDNDGNVVYRTVVKAIGTGGRVRNASNSDTPQGTYKILEWRKTGTKRYNRISFGPNKLLALEYQGGEGGSRQGMHVHGGRQEGKYKARKNLASTHGCMRINDDDIAEIRKITDKLEKDDPSEKKGNLTLVDDLSKPAVYNDKRHEGTTETVKEDHLSLGEIIEKFKTENDQRSKEIEKSMEGVEKVLKDINSKESNNQNKNAKVKS